MAYILRRRIGHTFTAELFKVNGTLVRRMIDKCNG